jgi:AmmeMemoRadiSam system protein A
MPSLSEADRRVLLELARESVIAAVFRHELPGIIPKGGIFALPRAVFVTIRIRGRLRGCIGVIEAEEPLGEAVVRCAASAALHDPRFPPLRQEDLADLEIELSLLSPLAAIRAEEVEIGTHGLLVSRGAQRGLLLPHVAQEHRLNKEQFLEETCHKAGLPRTAWRDSGTKLFAFTCEVFSDYGRSGIP